MITCSFIHWYYETDRYIYIYIYIDMTAKSKVWISNPRNKKKQIWSNHHIMHYVHWCTLNHRKHEHIKPLAEYYLCRCMINSINMHQKHPEPTPKDMSIPSGSLSWQTIIHDNPIALRQGHCPPIFLTYHHVPFTPIYLCRPFIHVTVTLVHIDIVCCKSM